MPFVLDILSDPSIPASARQQALDRILSDPGIPQPSTTSSFWLQDPRIFQVHSTPLPHEVDVVIIGSGITGASVARSLLENGISPTVLMLEARSICSGATGRNGGHVLETGDYYADLADHFGVKEAERILRFRLAHLGEMMAASKGLGIDESQTRKVQFLSVYFAKETWEDALERLRRFKEGMPAESTEWTSFEGEEIPEVGGSHILSISFLTSDAGVPSQARPGNYRWSCRGSMALQIRDWRARLPTEKTPQQTAH